MTFEGTFSEINLDSSIIDVILLTNLIFLASKLEVPTLNTNDIFLRTCDFKEMAKLFTYAFISVIEVPSWSYDSWNYNYQCNHH
jgi:hypothetical protein